MWDVRTSLPSTESRVALGKVGQRCPSSVDQQCSGVFVSPFADPKQLWSAACCRLTWDEPEPCRKITAVFESFRLADRGGQGRTGHHTDARDCRQPTPRAWIDHCHVESPVRGMDEHLPKPASHRRAARSPQGHAAKWNGARLPFGENLRALVICLPF